MPNDKIPLSERLRRAKKVGVPTILNAYSLFAADYFQAASKIAKNNCHQLFFEQKVKTQIEGGDTCRLYQLVAAIYDQPAAEQDGLLVHTLIYPFQDAAQIPKHKRRSTL